MRLTKARITKYRSIRDTGEFKIEPGKTIMVGPNEAGKTVILQAIQQLNAPGEVAGFDPLRDYPRSEYNDITAGKVKPVDVTVVVGHFVLEDSDKDDLPEPYRDCTYVLGRRLNNTSWHELQGDIPKLFKYADLENDFIRLCAHIDARAEESDETPSQSLNELVDWHHYLDIKGDRADGLIGWLKSNLSLIEEGNETEEKRYDKLVAACKLGLERDEVLSKLFNRVPVFVLFNNYYRVRPRIHLDHLAKRIDTGILDDEQYDYGNTCLLKLLGFSARDLADLGSAQPPAPNNMEALKEYQDKLDKREYQLDAASVRLTDEIVDIWNPDPDKAEADRLQVKADGQYLKVVVEDELGVKVELDQRSQGFQWLVSFFIVFFAEAQDKHENAILLLDEPGLNLHGLKQREFRETITKLAKANQTLYTTHSPFLVGPDELDSVRVVDMTDRKVGTKVHGRLNSSDPAALLPLQEALGYDLAQSLFSMQRNLVLEGLTDYWYIEAVSQILRDSDVVKLNEKIALVFANTAGKVVYYATILHAHKLKVAALLDSDSAGDQAAGQETLVHTLGNRKILRTKDSYAGEVERPEIEDLLRDTLVSVANEELRWDVKATADAQTKRPIIDIFEAEISDFSKYRLAKAFLRWAREHGASDLTVNEQAQCKTLIETINKVLK